MACDGNQVTIIAAVLLVVIIFLLLRQKRGRKEGFWVSPECACSCSYGQPNGGLTNGGRKKKIYSTAFGYAEF